MKELPFSLMSREISELPKERALPTSKTEIYQESPLPAPRKLVKDFASQQMFMNLVTRQDQLIGFGQKLRFILRISRHFLTSKEREIVLNYLNNAQYSQLAFWLFFVISIFFLNDKLNHTSSPPQSISYSACLPISHKMTCHISQTWSQ